MGEIEKRGEREEEREMEERTRGVADRWVPPIDSASQTWFNLSYQQKPLTKPPKKLICTDFKKFSRVGRPYPVLRSKETIQRVAIDRGEIDLFRTTGDIQAHGLQHR